MLSITHSRYFVQPRDADRQLLLTVSGEQYADLLLVPRASRFHHDPVPEDRMPDLVSRPEPARLPRLQGVYQLLHVQLPQAGALGGGRGEPGAGTGGPSSRRLSSLASRLWRADSRRRTVPEQLLR